MVLPMKNLMMLAVKKVLKNKKINLIKLYIYKKKKKKKKKKIINYTYTFLHKGIDFFIFILSFLYNPYKLLISHSKLEKKK